MKIEENLQKIREFLYQQYQKGRKVKFYKKKEKPQEYFKEVKIGVNLDEFKDIILQEETSLELGGPERKSFSTIYPLNDSSLLDDGNIVIIGPEFKEISEKTVDFGIFLLIGTNFLSEQNFDQFRNINFISNGIEGFMIRTIPRRFWCRISNIVINKISFEFLANAILYLYNEKFGDLIKSIEIILMNSEIDTIDSFIEMTTPIRDEINLKWKEKVKEWKRRIDCDFGWNCNDCPYYDVCEDIKEVLEEREVLDK
ncbi:MAG: hypothetical protein ACFE8V_13750 [Promethearchaeota archaeon]